MKRKSLGVENLEQRTVLSASAVVALDHLAAADSPAADTAVAQLEMHGGGEAIRTRLGDFNTDGIVNADDIDMLCGSMNPGFNDVRFDLNDDGSVDTADMDMLIRDIIGTEYGDLNLDGNIDRLDAGLLFHNMFTEASGWANGDFSCDDLVDGIDFLKWNEFKFTETPLGSRSVASPIIVAPTVDQALDTAPVAVAPAVAILTAPLDSTLVMAAESPVVTETSAPVQSASVEIVEAPDVTRVADQADVQRERSVEPEVSDDASLPTVEQADRSAIRLRFATLRRSFS